jgi:hypothetical protein
VSREFSIALLNSVRFHLKLYRIARPASSYSLAALRHLMERISARNGATGNTAQLIVQASGSKLRMTLRLPARSIAQARLRALPRPAPPDVKATLKTVKGLQVLTLETSIPERG